MSKKVILSCLWIFFNICFIIALKDFSSDVPLFFEQSTVQTVQAECTAHSSYTNSPDEEDAGAEEVTVHTVALKCKTEYGEISGEIQTDSGTWKEGNLYPAEICQKHGEWIFVNPYHKTGLKICSFACFIFNFLFAAGIFITKERKNKTWKN